MDNTNRVDPELQPMLELYPPTELNPENLAATREMGAKMSLEMNAQLPEVEGVIQEDRLVSGPVGDPDVRVRIYKPSEQKDTLPGFLWIHGGGYMLGSLDGDDYASKLRVKGVVAWMQRAINLNGLKSSRISRPCKM